LTGGCRPALGKPEGGIGRGSLADVSRAPKSPQLGRGMTGLSGRGEQARTAGFELKNDCQNSMNVEE